MWLKADDKMHDHPKVHDLLEAHDPLEALASLGLWLLAGTWCGDQLSDGKIRESVLRRWAGKHAADLADNLVDVGLWDKPATDDRGRRVHAFHDFLKYNDSRDKVLADRHAANMRRALYRDVKLRAAIDDRDGDRCRYCGSQVVWADRRGPAGGTYDHVIPVSLGGLNTLDNLVICCRRCNNVKGDRTLEQACMVRLDPRTLGAPQLDDDRASPSAAGLLSGRVGARCNPATSLETGTPDNNDHTDEAASSEHEPCCGAPDLFQDATHVLCLSCGFEDDLPST